MPLRSDNPFTAADLETVKRNLRSANDLLHRLDKAEKCGVSCEQRRATLQYIVALYESLRDQWMTPPPPPAGGV